MNNKYFFCVLFVSLSVCAMEKSIDPFAAVSSVKMKYMSAVQDFEAIAKNNELSVDKISILLNRAIARKEIDFKTASQLIPKYATAHKEALLAYSWIYLYKRKEDNPKIEIGLTDKLHEIKKQTRSETAHQLIDVLKDVLINWQDDTPKIVNPLTIACLHSKEQAVKFLLELGEKPTVQDLSLAVRNSRYDIAEYLLEVAGPLESLSCISWMEERPIFLAAINLDEQMVKTLVKHGVDLSKKYSTQMSGWAGMPKTITIIDYFNFRAERAVPCYAKELHKMVQLLEKYNQKKV